MIKPSDVIGIIKSNGPWPLKLLLGLLFIDMMILMAYVLYGAMDIVFDMGKMPLFWNIAEEGSASELFNYLKWIFIFVALLISYNRSKVALFASFAIVFALVLMDDSLQLHERGGEWAVNAFQIQPAFGLRAQDFGELTAWAGLGAIAGLVLIWGYFKRTPETLPYGLYFLIVLGGLVFTAMGIDMLNAWDGLADDSTFSNVMTGILTIAEDGGEMIVGSIGCAGAMAALIASKAGFGQNTETTHPVSA